MNVPVKEQIIFIKNIRAKYGLSADNICDIVARAGGFVSVNTVRRIIAKDAEGRSWRADTVAPVYEALRTTYSKEPAEKPRYAYPHYTQEQYEKLVIALKSNVEQKREENAKQQAEIKKLKKMVEILWHGLQCSEDYEAVVKKYIEEGGVIHG